MMKLTPAAQKVFRNMMCRMRACWEQGMTGMALMELGMDDALLCLCDDMLTLQHADGRLAACHTNTQTDPALCIHSVLRAFQLTNDPRYADAIARHRADILATPWRSEDGVLYHFKHSKRIWADSAAMLPAALAALELPDMAVQQLVGLCNALRLSNGLYGHQWNDESKSWDRIQPWSAGNGWILTGLAWTMVRMNVDHPQTPVLMKLYQELTEALAVYRLPNGLYHDIADDPATFTECQTAAMQAYSQLVLRDAGLLPGSVTDSAAAVLDTITAHMDAHGAIHDTPGAPDFAHNGTSTEMQAFWLMLWARLNTAAP